MSNFSRGRLGLAFLIGCNLKLSPFFLRNEELKEDYRPRFLKTFVQRKNYLKENCENNPKKKEQMAV
jgi:hypothetical protein